MVSVALALVGSRRRVSRTDGACSHSNDPAPSAIDNPSVRVPLSTDAPCPASAMAASPWDARTDVELLGSEVSGSPLLNPSWGSATWWRPAEDASRLVPYPLTDSPTAPAAGLYVGAEGISGSESQETSSPRPFWLALGTSGAQLTPRSLTRIST